MSGQNILQTQAPRQPRRVRHDLRFRLLRVTRVEQVTPYMIFITLQGDLQGFVSLGFDDHVKVFFPPPGAAAAVPGVDAASGRIVWPGGMLPHPGREYTPINLDMQAQTLQLAFAMHEAGPAVEWARRVRVGDALGLGGPRGSSVLPLDFDGYVMVADDTALPAVLRRLQEFPAQTRALVLAEVEDESARLDMPCASSQVRVQWVYRRGGAANDASRLLQALQQTEWPQGDVHVWIAGESSLAKALRIWCVQQRGQNPKWIRAAGYWCQGSAGKHEVHDD